LRDAGFDRNLPFEYNVYIAIYCKPEHREDMMSAMIRTQIYIPRDVYEELKRRSKSTGLAMAEQIRQALREYLEREEGVMLREDDPIWNIVGGVSTGDGDLSIHHDKYLYGWNKEQ
jgi:predicted DNA-binding protein